MGGYSPLPPDPDSREFLPLDHFPDLMVAGLKEFGGLFDGVDLDLVHALGPPFSCCIRPL